MCPSVCDCCVVSPFALCVDTHFAAYPVPPFCLPVCLCSPVLCVCSPVLFLCAVCVFPCAACAQVPFFRNATHEVIASICLSLRFQVRYKHIVTHVYNVSVYVCIYMCIYTLGVHVYRHISICEHMWMYSHICT